MTFSLNFENNIGEPCLDGLGWKSQEPRPLDRTNP